MPTPTEAQAILGIILVAAGTDVALETADVALMVGNLSNLSVAVVLSPRILTHHSPEFVRLAGRWRHC